MHICPYVIVVDVMLREWNGDSYETISREAMALGEVCMHLGADVTVDQALLTASSLLRERGSHLTAATASCLLSLAWKPATLPFD